VRLYIYLVLFFSFSEKFRGALRYLGKAVPGLPTDYGPEYELIHSEYELMLLILILVVRLCMFVLLINYIKHT
jgi:hypothetical protein